MSERTCAVHEEDEEGIPPPLAQHVLDKLHMCCECYTENAGTKDIACTHNSNGEITIFYDISYVPNSTISNQA